MLALVQIWKKIKRKKKKLHSRPSGSPLVHRLRVLYTSRLVPWTNACVRGSIEGAFASTWSSSAVDEEEELDDVEVEDDACPLSVKVGACFPSLTAS